MPFERERPRYAPIDEEHPPLPESSYALSKLVSEEMARQFSRWTGIPFVGLRFSNVMEPHDYERFPGFWDDPQLRRWNLWGYVDARDVAQSCRLGLEADVSGAEVFIIAAADTVMNRPSADLMAEVYPDVELRAGVGEFEHAAVDREGAPAARLRAGVLLARRGRPQHVAERVARLEQLVARGRVGAAARGAEPALRVVEAEEHLGPGLELVRVPRRRQVGGREVARAEADRRQPSHLEAEARVVGQRQPARRPDGGRAPAGRCTARTGR